MLITSAKSIYIEKQFSKSACMSLKKTKHFTTHIHILTSSAMKRYSGNIFLFIIFPILYYSLTQLSRSWSLHSPLSSFMEFSEQLIKTSHLLLRGGPQSYENYFGFAGRRSWQSFPSNSLSLAALNKAMESFTSLQTLNTDTISKCHDCSQNKSTQTSTPSTQDFSPLAKP